jgi:alkylated DNA repair dioxygenase AlkB
MDVERTIDLGDDNTLILGRYTSPVTYTSLAQSIPFQESVTHLFGKEYKTGRLVATMGAAYSYNGQVASDPTPIPSPVQSIMSTLSIPLNTPFNSCVANYYPDGSVGLGAHDDGEKETSHIATVSFGAERKCLYTKKDKTESYTILLKDRSIAVMCGPTFQQLWKHAIPKMKTDSPRISLTYRVYNSS